MNRKDGRTNEIKRKKEGERESGSVSSGPWVSLMLLKRSN